MKARKLMNDARAAGVVLATSPQGTVWLRTWQEDIDIERWTNKLRPHRAAIWAWLVSEQATDAAVELARCTHPATGARPPTPHEPQSNQRKTQP